MYKITKRYGLIFTISLVLLTLGSRSSYPQEDAMPYADVQKDDIRRVYNKARVSYRELGKKIKERNRSEFLDKIKKKIRECYKWGSLLEKQGRYEEARKWYKKALRLTDNFVLKTYIPKKNRHLRKVAKNQKRAVLKNIREIEKNRRIEKKWMKKVAEEERTRAMRSLKKVLGIFNWRRKEKERIEIRESELSLDTLREKLKSHKKAVLEDEKKPLKKISKEGRLIKKESEKKKKKMKMKKKKDKKLQDEREFNKQVYDASLLVEEGDWLYQRTDYSEAYRTYRDALKKLEKLEEQDTRLKGSNSGATP